MIQTKFRVGSLSEMVDEDEQLAVPVLIPDLDEIRKLANELHERGKEFDDEVWGRPVHYEPEFSDPPIDAQLTFTPASFWIGVWPVWYVSLTWEFGRDQEPSIL